MSILDQVAWPSSTRCWVNPQRFCRGIELKARMPTKCSSRPPSHQLAHTTRQARLRLNMALEPAKFSVAKAAFHSERIAHRAITNLRRVVGAVKHADQNLSQVCNSSVVVAQSKICRGFAIVQLLWPGILKTLQSKSRVKLQ